VLGLLTFLCVNYLTYINTYVSVDASDTVRVLNQFTQPEGYTSISDLINFIDYMIIINSASVFQLGFTEHEVGKTVTNIYFYIQILGVVVGSSLAAMLLGKAPYCNTCKKYYKRKTLKHFDVGNLEVLEVIVKKIENKIEDGPSLKRYVEDIKERDNKEDKYGELEILYCTSCYDGSLIIRYVEVDSKRGSGGTDELMKTFALNQDVVKELARL